MAKKTETKKPAYPLFNKGGRPPKYNTAEELQEAIQDYFDNGINYKEVVTGPPNNRRIEKIPVPTITGLVLHLGFDSRQSFYDLEKQTKFSYTIKSARTMIETKYEELLATGLGTGAIFALKNFGWVDKQIVENEGSIFNGGKVTFEVVDGSNPDNGAAESETEPSQNPTD